MTKHLLNEGVPKWPESQVQVSNPTKSPRSRYGAKYFGLWIWVQITCSKACCLKAAAIYHSLPILDTCQLISGRYGRHSSDRHHNWLYDKQHGSNTDIWPSRLEIFTFQSLRASQHPCVCGVSTFVGFVGMVEECYVGEWARSLLEGKSKSILWFLNMKGNRIS